MKITSRVLLLALLLIALSGSNGTLLARAQTNVQLENVTASVEFGEQITFIATLTATIPIQDVSIVISEEGDEVTYVASLTIQPDGRVEFRFDAKQNGLRPFAIVNWQYRFTFQDGSTAQSEAFSVHYADDRFEWQTVEADGLRVSWYHPEANFGQAALDATRAGLEIIGKILPPDLSQPIEILVYTTADDLRATLIRGGEEWVAGHADPALGVVMVVIEPGVEQGILMEQRIPHELMHVMLYRRVGAGYSQIPVWLREGISTLVEIYPNPDYESVLADALAGNRLIPFAELCGSFPAGAGQAFLAYAQSRSFTRYLHDHYGSTGLLNLATTYADGVDCDRGPERAFGVALSKLEADWRSSVLGQNPFLPVLQGIAPYLVLLCLILVIPLIGITGTLRKKGNRNGPEAYVRK